MSDVEKNIGTHKPEFAGEWVKLGDVCEITMGQSPDSSSYNADCEGLPFYQGNADFGETHPTPRIWCSEPKKVAEAGDILISVRAPVGAINVADERCCIGRGLAVVRPSGSDISNAFLALILQSKRAYLDSMSTGSTFKAIGKKVLSSCEAPLYSHEVQSRIACQINGIDDCLRSSRKLLSTLDDLVKSQFVEMFERREYPVIRLGDGVKRMHIGPFGSALKSDCFCDEVSADCVVYEQRHAIHSAFATEYRYINKNKHEELKRFEVGPGDLIISCRGTIGKVAVIPEDAPRGIIHPSLMLVSVDDAKYDVEFFRRMLIDVLGSLEQRAKGNCVKMAVKASELEEIKVPLPPLALQQQFADFVAKVDKLGFDVQQQIEKLETLKQSLMQEYFG